MAMANDVMVAEGTSPQFGDLSTQAMRFVQGGRDVYGFALTLMRPERAVAETSGR